ncbi:MAG: insulinase family protein [Rhodobacteraceae bacterium]|nr:insulinase family protein [Paracoccaceae bacterium]
MRRATSPLTLSLALVLPALVPAHAGDVTEFTLDNGMDVVVIEDHRSPAVEQMVWYKVGSADEAPGVSGVAHLLEHLMFKGTDTHAPGEFSAIVEAHGGEENAFTTTDYTAYYQRVAADLLPKMMDLEADRMTHLRLTPDQVAPEVSVVLEERNQRVETNPDALFREQAQAAQYLNHPYGHPTIGWRHEVAALGADQALDFYRAHYVPNNAILVVAGDVTPDEVRKLAETYYGPIPANPDLAPRIRPSEPPQTAARHLVFEDPRVAQPYVTRSYLAPERNSGDQKPAAALELLAGLLGGEPATSYLGRRLQFDDPKAIYTGAYYSGTSLDPTTFSLVIVPAPGVSLADAEAALDGAVADFLAEGVDSEQLARLKRQYAAESIYELDDVGRRAQRYGRALATSLTVADVEAWPDILQSVSEDDIMAAARAVLVPQTSVTGWLRAPEGAAPVAATPVAGFPNAGGSEVLQ